MATPKPKKAVKSTTARVGSAGVKASLSKPVVANDKLAKRTDDPAVLRALAGDGDPRVRTAVASNSATPAAVLRVLAKDAIVGVAAAVARNANTPSGILEKLASSKEARVRLGVANNPGAPIDLLRSFLRLDEPPLKNAALENPGLPFADRLAFVESDAGRFYRYHVVADQRVPPETVAQWVRAAQFWYIEDQRLLDLVLTRPLDSPILHALVVKQVATVWGSRALNHPGVTSDMLLEIVRAGAGDMQTPRQILLHPRADHRVLAAGLANTDFTMLLDSDIADVLARELGNLDRFSGETASTPPPLVLESPVAVTLGINEDVERQLRRLSRQYAEPVSRLRVVSRKPATVGWHFPLSPAGGRHSSSLVVEGSSWAPSFVIEADDKSPTASDPGALTLSLSADAANALSGTSIRWSVQDQQFYFGSLGALEAADGVPRHVVVIP